MQVNRNMRGAWLLAALAAIAGCGGGSDEEMRPAVTGAAPAATQGRVAATAATPSAANDRARSRAAPAPAAAEPIAHGAILLDPLVASRVHGELDQVEQGLQFVPDAEPAKREALEVIRELRTELDKDQPNRLKVRGLLGGLAHGIRSLEGWRGAGKLLPQLIPLV